jgi:hypothetical protein
MDPAIRGIDPVIGGYGPGIRGMDLAIRGMDPVLGVCVKICRSVFQHDSHYCTPQKCSGFNQMEEAKVSFRDGWLDTPCRIHSGVNRKRTLSRG